MFAALCEMHLVAPEKHIGCFLIHCKMLLEESVIIIVIAPIQCLSNSVPGMP